MGPRRTCSGGAGDRSPIPSRTPGPRRAARTPRARRRCARGPPRTWARTRPLPAGPLAEPRFLERAVHEVAGIFGQRAQWRADVGFVDDPQPHERVLDASAVVADGQGEDGVAQGLEHVAELERAGEIIFAHGPVHLDLLARGEGAEAKQRALGPKEIRLKQEVVVTVQDGGA